MASTQLADEALTGFAKSAAYDKHRPSYPADAVEKLLGALRVDGVAEAAILDLAAGTGKFTELLASRPENYRTFAVEPHDEMRRELETKNLSNVAVKAGLATSIPLPDESVDAVIAAQVRTVSQPPHFGPVFSVQFVISIFRLSPPSASWISTFRCSRPTCLGAEPLPWRPLSPNRRVLHFVFYKGRVTKARALCCTPSGSDVAPNYVISVITHRV